MCKRLATPTIKATYQFELYYRTQISHKITYRKQIESINT